MRDMDPVLVIGNLVVILLSLSVHEFAHAKTADMAGDPTPRYFGRVTLNPIRHLDPLGTLMIIISTLNGFGIGWGKPVLVDPRKMRNPRWDHFVSVIAGPISNLLQAAGYAIIMRVGLMSGILEPIDMGTLFHPGSAMITTILLFAVWINLGLFYFNLIPIGPLDGHWLVGAFLPEPTRIQWYRFNRGIGSLIFIVLVLVPSGSDFDLFGRILFPLVTRTASFFLGM